MAESDAVVTRTVRGCLTVQLQQECTEKSETNPSVPQQEEQADAAEGKVIAGYKPDVDYKPEGSDPEIKPVDHNKEEENSGAEYVKMEFPHQENVVT